MKSVLLLNPPASPRISRDYYCGHYTKGKYYWPQLDLLVMSGMVAEQFDVQVLDAVVEGLDADQALARVEAVRPDAVLSMTSSVSWKADMAFLEAVRDKCGSKVVITGDYARTEPAEAMSKHACIDAIVLDFSENDVVGFLAGDRPADLRNIYTRSHLGAPSIVGTKRFSYAAPRHDLFPLNRYHVPQALHHPFTSVLTDFGCPFACDFCFMEKVRFRPRAVDNVAEELAVIRDLGVREMFVADQAFGSVADHSLEVCEAMRTVGKGEFSWWASIRVDAATDEMLKAMREAGCHTLMFGVETPNQEVLDAHKKRVYVERIDEAFARSRELGFRTLAHFIMGLTGETEDSLRRLIQYAIDLDPDIAAFNVAAPAWSTSFGEDVRERGLILDEGVAIAHPDAAPVWESPELPGAKVMELRDEAMRRFYMRPRYVLRQLANVRSSYHMRTLFREGAAILGRSLAGPSKADVPAS